MRAVRFALPISLVVAAAGTSVVGCADDGVVEASPDGGQVITGNDAGDAATTPDGSQADACADGGCVQPTDCTTVDFCGVTFPVTKSITFNTVWTFAPNDVWIGGTRGTILHGDGTSFSPVESGTSDIFFAFWGNDPSDFWAVDSTSPLHRLGTSPFAPVLGSTWNQRDSATGHLWAGCNVGSDVWIGAEETRRFDTDYPGGGFFRLGTDADGNAVWTRGTACPVDQPCSPNIRSIVAIDDSNAWAVGMKGQAFFLDDPVAGHWTFRNPFTSFDLEGVWASGADDIWAVGGAGTIRHITGKDAAWTEVESPTKQNLHAIWGTAKNDVWAVGDEGAVIHYDGTSWTSATIGLLEGDVPTRLLSIRGTGPDDVWIAGEGLVLHRNASSRRLP